MHRLKRRATTIGLNIFNSLAVPLLNAVVALLVIRLYSDTLWGAFVSIMIVVQFGAHLASWGNKEYLLREFSRHPQHIRGNWLASLYTRLLLSAGLAFLLIFAGYSPQRFALALAWGFGIVLMQSFEVFVVYRKAFLFDTLIKAASVLGMVLLLLVGRGITVDGLLALFALSTWLQSLAYLLRFATDTRRTLPGSRTISRQIPVDLTYFRRALPFFLLGFSGLLASRIDLYTISIFLNEREIGQYQVFINLMLYVQAVPNFIMIPFVKNLYRLPDSAIHKIAIRLFALGVLVCLPATALIAAVLRNVYHLEFSPLFMLAGALFVLPIYGYLPLIYRLYKNDGQALVLWVNLAGAGANLLLNLILLPVLGITAAILASALVQWGMLGIYLAYSGRTYGGALPEVSSSP